MRLEIYLDSVKLDIQNISLTDFRKETQEKKDILSKVEIDFSSIKSLKGDKTLLQKAFLNQMVESLNL